MEIIRFHIPLTPYISQLISDLAYTSSSAASYTIACGDYELTIVSYTVNIATNYIACIVAT